MWHSHQRKGKPGKGPAVRTVANGHTEGSHGTVAAATSPGTAWRSLAALVLIAVAVAATRWLWRDAALPQWSGVLLGGPEMALNPRLSPDGNLLASLTVVGPSASSVSYHALMTGTRL